jgi:hypothetical protein
MSDNAEKKLPDDLPNINFMYKTMCMLKNVHVFIHHELIKFGVYF